MYLCIYRTEFSHQLILVINIPTKDLYIYINILLSKLVANKILAAMYIKTSLYFKIYFNLFYCIDSADSQKSNFVCSGLYIVHFFSGYISFTMDCTLEWIRIDNMATCYIVIYICPFTFYVLNSEFFIWWLKYLNIRYFRTSETTFHVY